LTVALFNSDSPYTSLEGDVPVGLEPELAEYIANALGVQADFSLYEDRSAALAAVNQGEADIAMGCIHRSPSLTTEYLASTPYGKGYLYVATKRGDYVTTTGSLASSSVGVDRKLNEETRTHLYQADNIQITDYASLDDAKAAIDEETIRAYVCYENQAKLLLDEEELQVQNMMQLAPEEFCVAAQSSQQKLIDGIDVLIRQFTEQQ
ncbi:MAG: transporter substrate-binding domain-containing protein, partial [Clostridiales bacterium]|nr:transporter substrate-binding domain-containing protein [Clostridiales bacterium]